MATAKEFIHELRTRKVLSEKHVAVIEQSLLQPADEIPAADLAGYLVEQMIIPAAVSKAILDHLQTAEKKRPEPPAETELRLAADDDVVTLKPTPAPKPAAPIPVPPERKPQTPSKPSPQQPLKTRPVPPPVSPPKPSEPPKPPEIADDFFDGVEERSQATDLSQPPLVKGSWRLEERKRESKWDTPLVRYGVISLGLLVLASVVLVWLLTQRRADEVLAAADEAYQNGAYSQAVDGYNDFIAAFENNANVPKAKLRVSLSKIRLITETKSNWDKALALVREELPEMSRLPDFASEGRIELSAILPNIAEGLAAMADRDDSSDLIAQAETALTFVDEHVPGSMQPFNQLQAARRSLETTRRRIARNAEIVTVQSEIAAMLETVKATAANDRETARQQLADSYAALTRYQHAHPEMQGDAIIAAIKNDIARTEATCQKWVAQSNVDAQTGRDVIATVDDPSRLPVPKPVMLLTGRTGPAHESGGVSRRPFVSYAGENVYAINPATGEIVWRYHVGPLGIDRVAPLIISGLPDDNTLLADDRTRSLVMVDTATGSERFRVSLGETIYINPQPMWPINFVTSTGGKLMLIDLRKGERLGHVDLMQKADAPPCYDPQRKLVVQPAHHSALHVFRYDSAAAEPLVNVGVIATGHLAGTIYAAPIIHAGHLIVAEQTGPNSSTLKVFAPAAADDPVPWGDAPVQTVPLDGLVKSPPVINGNDLLYLAERGEIKMLSFAGAEPLKPYQVVAEGRIDDVQKRGEALSGRFALLADRSLWVTDNRLQRFEIQPSRSRFIPQDVPPTPAIVSQSPLEIVDGQLLQTYVDPVLGGAVSRSFALTGHAFRWQAEFGEAVFAQPVAAPDDTLHVVTLAGKLFDIPFAELTGNTNTNASATQFRTEPFLRQQLGTGLLSVPVTDLVPLADKLDVFCCVRPNTPMTNVPMPASVYVHDGNAPRSQVRIISIPAPMTSAAVPLGRGIVLPLANGQLAYYSPVDGSIMGNPLVARRTVDAPPKWSPMTLTSKRRLAAAANQTVVQTAVDTAANASADDIDEAVLIGDADGLLRQVELLMRNNRLSLVATKSLQLPCPITSKPLVCGRSIVIADDAGHLMLFDYDQLTPEGNTLPLPQPRTVDEAPATTSTPAPQPAVNQTYGGVIVTADIEAQSESPFVIDASSQADNNSNPIGDTPVDDDAPYQAWELDGPVVWGPFACGQNAAVAVTEQNTFVVVTHAGQTRATLRELTLEHGRPVGQPFAMSDSQLLFVTRNGTLVRYDLPQNSLTPIMTTGVTPSCGPMILHSKIIVFGIDGAIYAF